MKKLSIPLLILVFSVPVFAADAKKDIKFPKGKVESVYEACKDVLLVDQNEYEKNKQEWDKASAACGQPIRTTKDVAWNDFNPLVDTLKFLPLAQKVTEKVKKTLEENKLYADCTALCFKGASACDAKFSPDKKDIQCDQRKKEVVESMKVNARKIRIEHALSRPDNLDINNVVSRVKTDPERFINLNLRDFDTIQTDPTPFGGDKLTAREIAEAKRRLAREHKMILEQSKQYEHNANWLPVTLMNNFERHKEKYRSLIYAEAPVFAYVGKPAKIVDGEATWNDKDIAKAYEKISEAASKSIEEVKKTLKENTLEFSRANGDAIAASLYSMVPFTTNKHDLLYYMSMKGQVEEVLKQDPSLCGIANTIAQRSSKKQIENTGVIVAASLGTGLIGRPLGAIFNVGRALTGAEAIALTGSALGGYSLAEAQKKYVNVDDEATAGIRKGEELKEARDERNMALALSPVDAVGGVALAKGLKAGATTAKVASDVVRHGAYTALQNQMAKDLPEVAILMKIICSQSGLEKKSLMPLTPVL